jgi:hypothetical protein
MRVRRLFCPPVTFVVGARIRERGPTILVAPVPHERPARTGTVVWSGASMVVVHWDGAPAPDPERPSGDACALAAWLEPLPANDPPSPPERTAP